MLKKMKIKEDWREGVTEKNANIHRRFSKGRFS